MVAHCISTENDSFISCSPKECSLFLHSQDTTKHMDRQYWWVSVPVVAALMVTQTLYGYFTTTERRHRRKQGHQQADLTTIVELMATNRRLSVATEIQAVKQDLATLRSQVGEVLRRGTLQSVESRSVATEIHAVKQDLAALRSQVGEVLRRSTLQTVESQLDHPDTQSVSSDEEFTHIVSSAGLPTS